MRLNWLSAFAGGATVALLASAALWQFAQPRTYEACMLREMLGQHEQMRVIANRHCSRRFGIEFLINLATTFDWKPDGDVVRISVTEPNREYAITRAFFRFSAKDCRDARDRDYAEEVAGVSEEGDTFVVRPPEGVAPVCMIGRVSKARFR